MKNHSKSFRQILTTNLLVLSLGGSLLAGNPSATLNTVERTKSPQYLEPGDYFIERITPTLSIHFPSQEGSEYVLEYKDDKSQWLPMDPNPIKGTGSNEVFHVEVQEHMPDYRVRSLTAGRIPWESAMKTQGVSLDFPDTLRLYLDASSADSLHAIQDEVYSWKSLTGDIFFETWRHYKPTLLRNEHADLGPSQFVSFTGASMDGSSPELRDLFTNAKGLTFFGIAKNRGSGAQSYLRVTTGDSDLKVRAEFMRTLSDHRFRGRNRDTDSLQTVIGGTRQNEVWSIDTTVVDYANAEVVLYQDGEETGRSFRFQNPETSDSSNPRRIRLGSDTRDDPRFFFDGEIAAILLFDSRLTRNEINVVGLYLSEKYNLDFIPVLEETVPHKEQATVQVTLRMSDGHKYSLYLDASEVDMELASQLSFPISALVKTNPIIPFQKGLPLLVGEARKTTGERLYNNIILPREWPPATEDSDSDDPMNIPYLLNRPDVINVGIGRQLFVDDFLIAESTLERRFHYPTPYQNNPVLQPETPFELQRTEGREGVYEAVAYLGHGGFFFDPFTQEFRMYYTAGWRGPLVMATSQDLVTWSRPDLDGEGNNIAWAEGGDEAGWDNSIWIDIDRSPDEQRVHYLTQRPGSSHTLHLATDNHDWTPGVETGIAADYTSFFYNPFRDVWSFSIKRNTSRGRARDYAESPEFMTEGVFDQSVFWINADRYDPADPDVGDEPQLYSMNAIAYESLLLGIFYIHRGPNNTIAEEGQFPKNTDLHLAYSRDGFHWYRPDRQPFLAGSRVKDAWDRAYLHSTTGVLSVVGDMLVFPYTGFSGLAPTGNPGMYNGASIGMASLRRDGFASLHAGKKERSMTTHPIEFQGGHLFVNVDAPSGQLKVEILNVDGEPISGFSKNESIAISQDTTIQEIQWTGNRSVRDIESETIRLRFHLQNGDLYSFWFSASDSGSSGGYVGAGGPGFHGFKDESGKAAYQNPLVREIKNALEK